MINFIKWIIFKITKKEHKFTVKWCLSDSDGNRIEKDFCISTVGVYNKEDIHNKRLINKALNPNKQIQKLSKEAPKFRDCILSYNIICYYGYMKRGN